jgi:hypothetical protein
MIENQGEGILLKSCIKYTKKNIVLNHIPAIIFLYTGVYVVSND